MVEHINLSCCSFMLQTSNPLSAQNLTSDCECVCMLKDFSSFRILVFVEHLVEGVVELAGHGVDLQLLPDDLVLQLVNPEQTG